jgi:hypothetical protein
VQGAPRRRPSTGITSSRSPVDPRPYQPRRRYRHGGPARPAHPGIAPRPSSAEACRVSRCSQSAPALRRLGWHDDATMRGRQAHPAELRFSTAVSGMAASWAWAHRRVKLANSLASWTAPSSQPRGAGTIKSCTTSGGSSNRVTVQPSAPRSTMPGAAADVSAHMAGSRHGYPLGRPRSLSSSAGSVTVPTPRTLRRSCSARSEARELSPGRRVGSAAQSRRPSLEGDHPVLVLLAFVAPVPVGWYQPAMSVYHLKPDLDHF